MSVKLAVVGVGVMGSSHVKDVSSSDVTQLVAVCDIDKERADQTAAQHNVKAFYDYRDLLDQADLDGIIIATPHYDHTPISIDALQKGIHVLVEKPIAVHTQDAHKMIAAYEAAKVKKPELVFSAMFMQRTYGHWKKIKELIEGGELGKLVRATWIITTWFRTQSYYDNGGWRATWKGEGGGVLLNQCPHNLDLYQWLVGLPKRVAGFASLGKYHAIEVEDEVTGYFEHEDGMVGHFITTTAESPGTNRLEIVGEYGKLVLEGDKLMFYRNRMSMFKQIETAKGGFDKVEDWAIDVPYKHHGQSGHKLVTENFARAILNGEPLIAPAAEGLNSVMLGNAIMLSSFQHKPVDLPLDDAIYAAKLEELVRSSQFHKVERKMAVSDNDLSKSF